MAANATAMDIEKSTSLKHDDDELRDSDALTRAGVNELLRRKAELEAGLATVHELLEV